MFNAAMHAEEIQDVRDYGLDVTLNSPFDWSGIKGNNKMLRQKIVSE